LLKSSKKELAIVHCPRSHEYFGHSPFRFEKLRELGVNICLGTDSLASNDDLSLFAEMSAFQKEFPAVSAEEILKMVTLAPALALGKPHVLGRIRENYWADLIAIPITRSTSVFEEIIAFDGAVAWPMLEGRISA
jgi:aminodeoxyfutalosine deaminase